MTRLAPDLFDRRFDDLVELGRARIPSLAPDWTDHNLHDPGITLLELLAWTAEAEIYAVSRMRRDERAAYAALLGNAPRGPQPARGAVWPDRSDATSASARLTRSVVLGTDAPIHVDTAELPTYRLTHPVLWVAGDIRTLATLGADGSVVDHTLANARGGPAFLPFGEVAGPGDRLRIEIACRDDSGLFPQPVSAADGAYLTLGICTADVSVATAAAEDTATTCRAGVVATLVADGARFALPIVEDSTQGFMRTGVLVLDVAAIPDSPRAFVIELRAEGGFVRPPRIRCLDLNVLPVREGSVVLRELHLGEGLPDQAIDLGQAMLAFGEGAAPVTVEVVEASVAEVWHARETLDDAGPADRAYVLDAAQGRVTFGNGLNGRQPPAGAQIFVTYGVNSGAAGNVAPDRRWVVRGMSGVYGTNPDPVSGGTDTASDIDQRREARRRVREEHPLVTADDVVGAALALPAIEVVRAWVPPPEPRQPPGTLTLIAMRARGAGGEPVDAPETRRWLDGIRARLHHRMPLGCRLQVEGPQYVVFGVTATFEVHAGSDPAQVEAAVRRSLQERLALVPGESHASVRPLGVAVSAREVAAWIARTSGVRKVVELTLTLASGSAVREVAVPRHGLPKLDLAASRLSARRNAGGRP